MGKNKIPKIIHYCWFGKSELPDLAKKCIDSWKKYCPDYEIREWNESNYDVTKCDFIREAYNNKKWAFVSDYARIDIIYNYGGIYLDTDVEVIKSLDELLKYEGFMGFEDSGYVNTGLGFGAIKNHPIIKENLDYYNNINFVNKDGSFNIITCPKINTKVLISNGMKKKNTRQTVKGIEIFPVEYFCPQNYYNGKLKVTNNTFSIHRYSMSWLDDKDQMYNNKRIVFIRKFGSFFGTIIAFVYSFPYRVKKVIKKYGFFGTFKYILKKR